MKGDGNETGMATGFHNSLISADGISPQDSAALACAIEQLMKPVIQSMCEILSRTNATMEQLAAAQEMQNERLAALEREMRLGKLVTPTMVKYINAEIRNSARGILFEYGVEDDISTRKLSAAIRKAVLGHFAIGALHDLPQCEYQAAMAVIDSWMNTPTVMDAVRDARRRGNEG